MKKHLLVSFYSFFVPLIVCSQPNENDRVNLLQKEYKFVLKTFYTILYYEQYPIKKLSDVYFDATINSGMNKKIKPYLYELTRGLSKEELYNKIDKVAISNEGIQFGVLFELSLSDTNRIYFELSSNFPVIIENIWISDGILLGSKIRNENPLKKLLLVGANNDKSENLKVRDKPLKDSRVIDNFKNTAYFYYVPNANSNWWQVSRKYDAKSIVGYLHKSQIKKYAQMSNELKKKILMERKGC